MTFEFCIFTNYYNFNYHVQHSVKLLITVSFMKIIKGRHRNYGNRSKMPWGSLTIRLPTAWSKDNRHSVSLCSDDFAKNIIDLFDEGYFRSRFLLMWRRCHGRVPWVTAFEISSFLRTVAQHRQKHLSGGFLRCNRMEEKGENLCSVHDFNLEEIFAEWMGNNTRRQNETFFCFKFYQVISGRFFSWLWIRNPLFWILHF